MKQWFPFTDYDFYGYLASGALLIFAVDYWYSGSSYLLGHTLTFMQTVVAISLAYVAGQMIAIPASWFQRLLFCGFPLRSPVRMWMLAPNWFERNILGAIVGGLNPLPQGVKLKVTMQMHQDQAVSRNDVEKDGIDGFFRWAHRQAMKDDVARARISSFLNQYGMARNVALTLMVVAYLMFHPLHDSADAQSYGYMALVLGIGMFIRYLKFYYCFIREVLEKFADREIP